MRHHIVTGVLAVLAAVAASYGLERRIAPRPVKIIERQVEHQAVGKWGWGALTPDEQRTAADAIGDMDRREVEIFCGVPGCADLAEDIDEVFDMTHAASNVSRPVIDLGAGMGISPDEPQTRRIAKALRDATAGRIDLKVIDKPQPGGGIVIALGRKPRH